MGKLKLSSFSVNLPGIGTGELVVDESQKRAAWEMYIELITRIAVQPLEADEGLLREALRSLYTMFGETRRILREYGPDIAMPAKKKFLSFGAIAVDVLNVWLRPVLAKWHPMLTHYESTRADNVSPVKHEQAWEYNKALRTELEALRVKLVAYADLLADVSGVPSLHARPEE